jgi:hypothetical protein
MSNTPSDSNQPFEPPASEIGLNSSDAKPDQSIDETSFVNTQAKNVGSPTEDVATKTTDLDEL